ncbi:MAG TPA: hypothetical protein PKV16_06435 [Caldisericia bacterium]|nr:hypothetical protein [Caldisericia bacterium]HPQ93405.1 hypothetical protein [Caldisericia bacterium]HRV74865.1 hypothetical protein [Caldisericia bacterium]
MIGKVIIFICLFTLWAWLLIASFSHSVSHVSDTVTAVSVSTIFIAFLFIVFGNYYTTIRVLRDKIIVCKSGLSTGIHKDQIKKVYLAESSIEWLSRSPGRVRVSVVIERKEETLNWETLVKLEDYQSFLDAMVKLVGEDKVVYPPSV